MKYSLFLFLAALRAQSTLAVKDGDEICVDGFVMDFYCINRGTLFDNPTLETLRFPANHSVKCLIDVPSCFASPYEILLDPNEGEALYSRGFRLTDVAKSRVSDLAKKIGDCGACQSDSSMPLERGFRIVAHASIVDLNLQSKDVPALIDVHAVQPSHNLTNACQTAYQMEDIRDVIAKEIAAGNPNAGDFIVSGSSGGALQKQYLAHASLMLIGWGWLLPSGALIAKFFKHRPNGLWFKIHRACQTLGLVCALAGWIIILKNVKPSVFSDKGLNKYRHGIMGMTVMVGGLLQPINALVRPHPAEEGQAKTSARQVWEILHKGLGYGTLLLAVATIGLGTTLLPVVDDQKKFQMAYGIGAGSLLLMLVAFMLRDKRSFPEETKMTTVSEKANDEEEQPEKE